MNSLTSRRVGDVLDQLFRQAEVTDAPYVAEFLDGIGAGADPLAELLDAESRDYKAVYHRVADHFLSVSPEFGRLLYMCGRAASATRIVEFGTSFGISTIHLACAVRDNGHIDDPLVGRERPRPEQERGRGLWLANQLCDLVQVRSGPDGFSVSTGWMSFDSNTTSSARGVLAQDKPANEDWKPALVALEQQLRNEIRSTSEPTPTPAAARGPADDATVRRVEQLLAEAERRHSQELAVRFVEFSRDINMQRRADLMKIGQGFDDYNRQLLGQRQLINNAIRVSSTPQQ